MSQSPSQGRPRPLTGAERDALRVGTLVALRHMPYLAGVLYNLRPVAVPDMGGTGTDRQWRLYVDPEVLGDPDQLAARLLHEAGHLVRRHSRRADGLGVTDPTRWNLAADLDVNADLTSPALAGLPIPSSWPVPQHHDLELGMTAEEYYALLPEQFPTPDEGGDLGDSGQPRAGADSMPGEGHSCGSGSGGAPLEAEPIEGAPLGDDVDDPSGALDGISDGEADMLAREAAMKVESHQTANGRGSVPVGLARWADAALAPPVVDWRKELSAAVRRATSHVAGKVDYTYSRPSRRRIPNVILPSTHRPRPQIVTILDTSGSMRPEMLQTALAEIEGVCRRAGLRGPDHRVLTADAKVQSVQAVQSARDIKLRGGGGTDMSKAIDEALRLRPSPDIVVVMTDGFTPWPDSRPSRAKVIVTLLEGRRAAPDPPEWAHTVRIPAEKVARA